MGKAARRRPARLGEKLLRIRETLGLSQNEIIGRLGLTDVISRDNVSAYELGRREPSLLVLFEYARAAGCAWMFLSMTSRTFRKSCPPFLGTNPEKGQGFSSGCGAPNRRRTAPDTLLQSGP